MTSSSDGSSAPATDSVPLTEVWDERDILAEAQALGHVGAWAWLVATGQVWWSDEMYRIFGRTRDEIPPTVEAMLDCVHPDDREEVARRTAAAVEGASDYDLEHRVVRPDGEVRYVWGRGVLTRADDGTPLRLAGMVMDLTVDVGVHRERDDAVLQLAESEERHRLLA